MISHVNKNSSLFYPIVFLIDESGTVINPVRTPFKFEKLGRKHPSLVQILTLRPTDRYLLITSYPEWFGKSITYVNNSSTMIPIFGAPTPMFVPIPGNSGLVAIKLDKEPELEFRIPYEGQTQPLVRQQGSFFEIGVTAGGSEVYENPDGDDYRAGGGALISVGYSHQILDSPSWMARYVIGIRYQGGEGENRGIVAQALMVFSLPVVNFGFGLYGDFLNSAGGAGGQKTDFDPAIGYSVLTEWRSSDKLNFGLKYVSISYDTDNGINFDGNQVAIYMNWWMY